MAPPTTPSASKFAQYSFSVANSPFGKAADSADTTFESPTSSLLYINSQLLAHGFTRKGLDLSDMRPKEQESAVRCLFAMLQQRVDDLTHLETLATSHRTLSYDYELLLKKHKTVAEDAAKAQTKEQAAKSQLKDAQAVLKEEQESHKRCREESQKARTALAFVRNQAQVDIKRREAETARTLERWQKLVTDQSKLITSRSGLTCVNSGTGANSPRMMDLPGISRAALEESEDARSRLVEENDAFRRILLRITNGLQDGLVSLSNANPNNIERITAANLFESTTIASTATTSITSHASEAQKKVMGLLDRLAREVWEVERRLNTHERDREEGVEEERIQLTEANKEVERLQGEVARLDELLKAEPIPLPTLPSFPPPVDDSDEVTSLLSRQREALEEERRKFTEAAVKLGRERSEIEAERLAFLEEKRSLQLSLLLSDLPPTPVASATTISHPHTHASTSSGTPQRHQPRHHHPSLLRSALKQPRSHGKGKGREREVLSEWNGEDEEEEEGDETVMLDPAYATMGSPRRAKGSPLTGAGGARKVRFPLGSPRRRLGGSDAVGGGRR